jgi:hypothetical protein
MKLVRSIPRIVTCKPEVQPPRPWLILTLGLQTLVEPNISNVDCPPRKEASDGGQVHKPVEDSCAVVADIHER